MTALKPYPQYKPSGVEWLGDIPAGWEVKRLQFLAKLNPSKSELTDRTKMVSFLAMENVSENGELTLDVEKSTDEVISGYTYFAENDVIVAKITPCFENGKAAICKNLKNGIGFGSTEFHVLRPTYKTISEFLFYIIHSEPFLKMGEIEMKGAAGQKRVPEDFISNLVIPFIGINEQRYIVQFLNKECRKIDALIAKSEKMVALLDEKRQAVITHGIFGNCPLFIRLKFRVTKIGSGVTPKGGAQVYQDSGVLLIRSQNVHFRGMRLDDVAFISEETDAEMINSRINEGDVLLNITGASIGRCNFIGKGFPKANVNQHVCILRPNKAIVSEYLNYCLQTFTIQHQIDSLQTGSSREGLNFEQIGNLIIPNHNAEEQTQIVHSIGTKIAKIDALKEKIIKQIELLKERKTSLTTSAVTGKIDARDYKKQQEAA